MLKLNSNGLKIIALITMTIDHIGYLLFPDLIFLRIIGRLSFPIYAYLVANSYNYTRNVSLYFFRMLGFACFTQVLYFIFEIDYINVLFTFTLGILAIYGSKNKKPLLVATCVALAVIFNPDYNFYGVLLILMFYYIKDLKAQMLSMFLLTIFFVFYMLGFRLVLVYLIFSNLPLYYSNLIQFLAMLALPLIHMHNHQKIIYKKRRTKLIIQFGFYLYYPIHFILLTLIAGGM